MDTFIITCEHGGNRVPAPYRELFRDRQQELLDSHRGWNSGAPVMAKALAASHRAPLVASTTSRLVIDLERCHRPYRDQVEHLVTQSLSRGHRVITSSSHSSTPELDGVRSADVGLRARRNYPCAARGDGLTSHLRLRFAQGDHAGIEREVNQALAFAEGRRWTALRGTLIDSLHAACAP
jgi:predicted N-formylglutamate amidohydrolase